MPRIARLLLVLPFLLMASAEATVAVPAPLQPWRDWALDQQAFRDCAVVAGAAGTDADDYRCTWPGALEIAADATGATFSQRWQVQAEAWVPLPGDAEHWPQDVRVDGQALPVVERNGSPQLRLPPGSHAISGRFAWSQRPQALAVPTRIGLVRLLVDGQGIAPVQHDDGELVLGRGASVAPEADALDLRVYRQLSDGVPMMLETRIELGAAGQAREEVIGPVLPDGFVPTAIEVDAGWPARIEADGRLRLQVQPDVARIVIRARALADRNEVAISKRPPPWPGQEIWSYQGNPVQRVTHAGGPTQVDPGQAGVPAEWRTQPAFAMVAGTPLVLELRSRGLGPEQGNRLVLARQAWLDHSGAGWTFSDRVTGQMRQDWRLDAQAPFRLESARDNVEDQALLVTAGANGATGVEWRTPQVGLSAGLRMEPAARSLPVNGWQQTFDSVSTRLHLPPGYRLIAAPGSDSADGSWVSAWTLLDIFLVAIVGLFAWRHLGPAGAAVAALYLAVAYHEQGAPLYSLAAALALGLLLRVLPEGRLQRAGTWLRRGAWLLLVLLALPFVADQLRLALYPQLEGVIGGHGPGFSHAQETEQMDYGAAATDAAAVQEENVVQKSMMSPPSPADSAESATLDRIEVTGSRIKRSALLDRYSQNTVVQAGRGLPTWRSPRSYGLSWSGPVTVDQSVSLLIAPPWLTRSLRVLAVLGLAWLVLRLGGLPMPRLPRPDKVAPALVLLASVLAVALPMPARAQALPDTALLDELRSRLTRAPECAPDCASIARASVQVSGDRLLVVLDMHASQRIAVPVPHDAESLSLQSLVVDGEQGAGLAREDDAWTLPLERGVHRVQMEFRITGERVALAFPMTPRAIEVDAVGWQATGVAEGRLLTETLSLGRLGDAADGGDPSAPAQEFPPYVRVTRMISLGLDWTVSSVVSRIAPAAGGFSVKLPVIAGEKVTTAGLQVREGRIEVPLPDGQNSARWESNLDKADALELRAPDLADHAEVWQITVSPLWRARFSGVAESVVQDEAGDDWHTFTFQPLPGEVLTMIVTRPGAVAGATQALESVSLDSRVGKRSSEHTLSFDLRASQGGERIVTLPDGAELLSVARDDQTLGLRLEKGRLSLPVQPGNQRFVLRFRSVDAAGAISRSPVVDLGLPAANIRLDLALPEDRWLLWTWGPRSGPAVLYWGELVVMLLVAFGLSRLRWTPLKGRDWLLLGLGFSTFSWWALSVVVAWLFALAWRERHGSEVSGKWRFDTMQLLLVGLSFAAAIALVTAIPYGLLGSPDMHVVNPEGRAGLGWFADQSEGLLPVAGSLSAPMWLYRVAMLAWALWLANAVIGWARWAIAAWMQGGYWRRLRKVKEPPAVPVTSSEPGAT